MGTSNVDIIVADSAVIGGNALSGTELGYLDGVTPGTGAASKAVVLDSGEDFTWPATGILKYGVLKDPAGTTLTATVTELNYLDIATLGTGAASKAVVLDAGEDYTWPATGVLTYGVLKDPAATTITATGAEINYLDIATLGTGAASKAVVLDAGGNYIWPATGALTFKTATAALIHGAGASGAAHALGATAANALEYYLSGTHTTGDMRGMYLRLYFAGAGGSGEAARIFSTVNNVAASTVHGAHISLSFGTTGSITGLGVANRNTLHVPGAMAAGTYYVNQLELWADAAASDLAGATDKAFTNYNLGGNGTGAALIEDTINLFHLTGGSIAGGNLVEADADETKFSHKIRINVYGTPMYLMACAT